MSYKTEIIETRAAGNDHQVVTVKSKGAGKTCRRKPCPNCPWRKDAMGEFPPEAFKHSARTNYDQSTSLFACHDSGVENVAICAGFLLRGADNNIAARLGYIRGEIPDVEDGGIELFDNYREMAIANGVDSDDPSLGPCRP